MSGAVPRQTTLSIKKAILDMTTRIRLQEAFKLALSMMLMYWLALWMDWDMPKYGGLAIVLVSLGTVGASLQKGLLRIVGTTFGLVVGLLLLSFFAQDRLFTVVFLTFYLVVIGYFMQGSQYGYAWFVAGFLPPLVWSTTYMKVDTAFHYAIFRYLETTAGIVIYTIVSTLFWPRYSGDQLYPQGKSLWSGFRKLFGLYRRQLAEGKLPTEAAALRIQLTGNLSQMMTTLQSAYRDTPSVSVQKRVWESLRVNVHVLNDALELWRESIGDCGRLTLKQLVPHLDPRLDTLEKRLERIEALWDARQQTEEIPSTDDDTGLLNPLEIKVDGQSGLELSHFDRAALMSFVQQLQLLDRVSRELLHTLEVLAGLDSRQTISSQFIPRDLFRPAQWWSQRVRKALYVPLCFVAAFVFWIYTDPPTGPSIPMFTTAVGLPMLLTPFNPMALLFVLVVSIWVAVAPVYFFVMPALDSGVGLLSLIFLYTFLFGYLGGRSPMLKMGPLIMFVMMTGISNQQTYSFIGLVNGAMMVILAISILSVGYMFWFPNRPERILLSSLKRFFRGCENIIRGFALYRLKDRVKGRKLRKHYFETMVLPVPNELVKVEKNLDYKLFPDNTPEKIKRLLDSLQSISFRLQTVELAHDRAVTHFPDLMENLSPLRKNLRERVQRVFGSWARFEKTDVLGDEQSTLEQMSRDLEKRLDAIDSPMEDGMIRDFYTLLGALKGLIEVMAETREIISQINWEQWATERF